jgi:hypothetical protein
MTSIITHNDKEINQFKHVVNGGPHYMQARVRGSNRGRNLDC